MENVGTGLAGIDTLIVIIYMIGMLVIGTYFGRYVKNAGDFFVAGRALPFWAIAMSIVVSDIGATDFIAVAGGTYKYGISQANFDWLGSMPALVIVAFLFIPYYWRSGVYTIPEFLGRRYNYGVQAFLAICWGLIMVTTLGIMLHATSVLLESVLGWPPGRSIWITAVVVGIYTITGGLTAVVMTDVLQLVIMFIGGFALVFRAIYEVGGLDEMQTRILALGPEYAEHFTLYLPHDTAKPFPWTGIVLGLGLVLSTAYYSGNQAVAQRALGARSEWDAKAGVLLAGLFKFFIPALVALPGLAAILIAPELADPDAAVPELISRLLPAGLRGLMFAAFLAALMSSVDSNLNSATTLWSQDIFGRLFARLGFRMNERQHLIFARLLSAVLLISAALIAPEIPKRFDNIYNAIQSIFSLVQGPTLAILLLGILWKRTTGLAAFDGLILGVGLCWLLNHERLAGIFPSEEPFLFISWWSFVFTIGVTVLISFHTDPEPEEKIRGLVVGSALADEGTQQVLRDRVSSNGDDDS